MKTNEINHIKYTRSTNLGGSAGEVTERYIIPTFIPQPNIKAIDVTDLDGPGRQNMASLMSDYHEYHEQQRKSIPSFESWLEQTHGVVMSPKDMKWRTFKIDNVELLEE